MTAADVLIPVVGLVTVDLYLANKRASGLPKPPGPKPLPLLGNVFDLPTRQLWLAVTDWSKIYGVSPTSPVFPSEEPDTLGIGKVTYAHVLGQGLLFLNTVEACTA